MINPNDYKFIADSLGESKSIGTDIANNIGSMITILDNSELRASNTEKLILGRAIAATYSFMLRQHTTISPQLRKTVYALQEHVVHRFGTVDNFLETYGLQVSQAFADLSAQLGYTIDPANIE